MGLGGCSYRVLGGRGGEGIVGKRPSGPGSHAAEGRAESEAYKRMTTQKPTLPRDYIIKSLLALLDTAERPGWWGEVGIAVAVQNGRIETIKKRTDQTEKGTP